MSPELMDAARRVACAEARLRAAKVKRKAQAKRRIERWRWWLLYGWLPSIGVILVLYVLVLVVMAYRDDATFLDELHRLAEGFR